MNTFLKSILFLLFIFLWACDREKPSTQTIETVKTIDSVDSSTSTQNTPSLKEIFFPQDSPDSVKIKKEQDSLASLNDEEKRPQGSLGFDALMKKFKYKDIKTFDFSKNWWGDFDNYYRLSFDEMKKLGLCGKESFTRCFEEDDYYPRIHPYSIHHFDNQIIVCTFLQLADGGFSLYVVSYKNKKRKSIGKENIAFSFGDIGTVIHWKAKLENQVFTTNYKEWIIEELRVQGKMITTIDSNGVIKQDRKEDFNKGYAR
ncbi:hypothetical protein AD998_13170 [bacterium 336/3]|nr:hypothetical protein AD998_13170 [bacterium 336/3]